MNGAFRLPLLPFFIPFTMGIYFGHFALPFPSQGWILLLLTLLGFWTLLLIIKRTLMGSWIAFSIYLLLGIFSVQLYLHPQHSPSHLSHFTGSGRNALGGIIHPPPRRSRGRTQLLIRSQKVIL